MMDNHTTAMAIVLFLGQSNHLCSHELLVPIIGFLTRRAKIGPIPCDDQDNVHIPKGVMEISADEFHKLQGNEPMVKYINALPSHNIC